MIRPYRSEDASAVARLYYESARTLGPRRYSPEQVAAWAPAPPDPNRVDARCSDGRTVLVDVDDSGALLAYADLKADGHIDHLYAAPHVAGTGAAGALLDRILEIADGQGMERLHVEASELARGLFERKGFMTVGRRDFERNGVMIHNWAMERRRLGRT